MSDLSLNLGIDFGTSFTKVVVRDLDYDRSWIVTFSKQNTTLSEALLPTRISICPDGKLLAGLTSSEWDKITLSFISIDFIKMRLANLDLQEEGQGHISDFLKNFNGIDLNTSENLENLCAYYLSKIILKAQEWILNNNTDLVKNQKITWSANIGVPVKYFDSKAIVRFRKVLRLAWKLTEISEKLPQDIYDLQKTMIVLRRDLETLQIEY
jgi:hypothetical protein